MEAACVALVLLLGWSAIGYGPSAILACHRPPVVRILLAPAVGIALVTLPTFWINRLGLPVQSFAAILTCALLAVSIAATLWAQKTKAALRRSDLAAAALLLVLLIGAMALVGWPGLIHGLNWLGYANDDMANYALSAARLRAHDYFEIPSLKAIFDSSDMSLYYWHLNQFARYGGDLVVALTASLLGKNEATLFMPTMVALHATLVGAAAALAAAERQTLGTAAVAVIIVAINPLVAFSTYSQLLPQVGGLALSGAFLSVLVEPWRNNVQMTIKTAIVAGVLLFALLIWYIEVVVFPLAALSLYFLINSHKFISAWRRLVPAIIVVLIVIALLSGDYLQLTIRFLFNQARKGGEVAATDDMFFPYFLIKTGLLSFWGLIPIIGAGLDRVSLVSFLHAIILFILAALGLIVALRERSLYGCITVILSALAAIMLYRHVDFALFKSVLWLQPFLAVLLAAQLARFLNRQNSGLVGLRDSCFMYMRNCMNSRRLLAASIPAMLVMIAIVTGAAQIRTLFFYARIAADEPGTVLFNQLPAGSRQGILRHLASLPRVRPGTAYVIDSDNTVLSKLIALYTIGTPLRIMSYNPFELHSFLEYFSRRFPSRVAEMGEGKDIEIPFEWPSSHERDILRVRRQVLDDPKPSDVLIATSGENSVLNRLQFRYPQTEPLIPRVIGNVSNHLSFLPTELKSRHYYDSYIPEVRGRVALWPNEPDYFFLGRTMVGAGRYIMLRAINPTSSPRLMLELTASLKADGDNRLPPVQVIGQSAAPLGAIGRGSARLYSRPLMPWRLGDASVVGIDMGVDGRRFTDPDGNLTLDIRRLTSFVRDISLVADNAYETLEPPSEVRSFPQGLADKALEYSGLYEDGWMAEAAFLRLAGPKQHAQFRISGQARGDAKAAAVSELVVRVDGVEKARQRLAPGQFTIAFDLAPSDGPIRVELQANAAVALSPADRRPASVQLSSVGWRPDTDSYPSAFKPASDRSDVAAAVGFWADGWAATRAQLTLADGAAGQLAIRGMAPKLEQPFTTKLVVTVDGKPIGTLEVEPGDVVADLPLAGSDRPRRITLEFEEGQDLPPPDARHVGMLVHEIAVK